MTLGLKLAEKTKPVRQKKDSIILRMAYLMDLIKRYRFGYLAFCIDKPISTPTGFSCMQ